jgi:hypothetical protein
LQFERQQNPEKIGAEQGRKPIRKQAEGFELCIPVGSRRAARHWLTFNIINEIVKQEEIRGLRIFPAPRVHKVADLGQPVVPRPQARQLMLHSP